MSLGKKKVARNALSWRTDHTLAKRSMILNKNCIKQRIRDGYLHEEWSKLLLRNLRDFLEALAKVVEQLPNFKLDWKLIHWVASNDSRDYSPNVSLIRQDVIAAYHEASHLVADKVYNSIVGQVFCLKMYSQIAEDTASFRDCQVNMEPNAGSGGELQYYEVLWWMLGRNIGFLHQISY